MRTSTLKIGHRGACGYEPENTLRSFKKAIELGSDMVELDVHVCRTGELVVIHDEKVDRTTNGKGLVKDMSLQELGKLNAGKGEQIPSLQDVFDTISKKMKINIELKGKNTAQAVTELIDYNVKKSKWMYDDFIVSSFDYEQLHYIKKQQPNINLGVLADREPPRYHELAISLQSVAFFGLYKVMDKKLIETIHNNNMQAIAWTVNDQENIKKLRNIGIDGIISDFPDRL